jgi:DNA-directed RNA polymerase subunit F
MSERTCLVGAFEGPFKYDRDSGRITDAENTLILEVRGFGHLTKFHNGDGEKACRTQDEIGNLVADMLSGTYVSPVSIYEKGLQEVREVLTEQEYSKLLKNIEEMGNPNGTLENIIYRVHKSTSHSGRFLDVGEVVNSAFTWSNTDEGVDYWSRVCSDARKKQGG